jgi:hypothetical protein
VWYYDADITADENLTEEEKDLGHTEGLDLAPLECSSATEVQRWIKEARSACCSRKGGGSRAEAYVLKTANFLVFSSKISGIGKYF